MFMRRNGLDKAGAHARRAEPPVNVSPEVFDYYINALEKRQAVTLTHAIVDDAPAATASAGVSSTSTILPVVAPTEAAPPASSEAVAAPASEVVAEVSSEAALPTSSSDVSSASPTTLSTAIRSEAIAEASDLVSSTTTSTELPSSATAAVTDTTAVQEQDSVATPTSTPIAMAQDSGTGDAQRVGAVGIALGATAGAAALMLAGVLYYKFKKRNKSPSKPGMGEVRQFQQI